TRIHPPARGQPYEPTQVLMWLRGVARHLSSADLRTHGLSNSEIVLHRWWQVTGSGRARFYHAIFNAAVVSAAVVISTRIVTGPTSKWFEAIGQYIGSFGE